MIKISKRLKAIADLVPDNSTTCDVGCDHALLDIYLYQTKKNIKLIASDINKNALSGAIKNIKKYNLEDKIQTVVSDGLKNLPINNIDTIIISGLGSATIISILKKEYLSNIKNIIISSHNHTEEVREYMQKLNFCIEEETIIKENNIYYILLKYKNGNQKLTDFEKQYGPIILKQQRKIDTEYLNNILDTKKKLYIKLPKGEKKSQLKKEINYLEKQTTYK